MCSINALYLYTSHFLAFQANEDIQASIPIGRVRATDGDGPAQIVYSTSSLEFVVDSTVGTIMRRPEVTLDFETQ